MNTQQRAAMQMALEALESAPVQYDFNSYPMLVMTPDTLQTTLTALREALAEQAEQEPVAWRWKNGNEWLNKYTYLDNGAPDCPELCEPLYAAPVYTKDLTDDEAQKLWNDTSSIVPMWAHHLHFARAVIAADREKNK